jgi:glycerophosphoryl diester phosphodiesterase
MLPRPGLAVVDLNPCAMFRMLWLFLLLLPLCWLLLSRCVPKQKGLTPNNYLISEGDRPWVIAHGGAKLLFPENTMVAFNGALALAVDALEMDVCMTADEVLVTHHNLTIDATSDGQGELISYSYSDLLAFNFGAQFTALDGSQPYRDTLIQLPRLVDVFDAYPNTYFIVELKNTGEAGKRAAERLQSIIQNAGVRERVVVASFDDKVIKHFYDITNGQVPISGAEGEVKDLVFSGLSAMEFLFRPKASVVQIPTKSAGINLASRRILRSLHRRDIAVQYWTINDPEEMRELIELGADGLITDRPDLMWDLLRDLGF